MGYDWLALVKNLQSIAYAGLTYSPDPYDQDRFQQLLQIVTKLRRLQNYMAL